MPCHVKRQFHARRRHARSASPEEYWGKLCPKWLHVSRRLVIHLQNFYPQCRNQLRRKHVAAGFARNEHEGKWFQDLAVLLSYSVLEREFRLTHRTIPTY